MNNKLIFGVFGILAITLFMSGFAEGISQYLGGISWYIKIFLGLLVGYFVGRKLI